MASDRIGGLFDGGGRNATLAWLVALALCALALRHALAESYRWFAFTGLAVAIVVAPAIALRDPRAMPPWELLLVVAVPVVDSAAFGPSVLNPIASYVAVAAVALVVAVELHRFTTARMNHAFAIVLVVSATLAVAAVWNVAQWASDALLGTAYIAGDRSGEAANYALMVDFVYAAVAGFVAGVLFDRYFRIRPGASQTDPGEPVERPTESPPPERRLPTPALIDRLNVSASHVRTLSRAMQVALGAVLLYGLVVRDVPTIANAGIAIGITFLPAALERERRLAIEPELALWLTAAVFLHALGSAGLYELVGQWDTLTHTVSASIVAAGGYAIVRAVDLHTDEVYLPPRLMIAFILVFVLALGVVWELAEFAIDQAARELGFEAVLAQHGIGDTIGDLVFDLVGAVVAAVGGSVYLSGVSHRIADNFGE